MPPTKKKSGKTALQDYTLVEFIHKGRRRQCEQIDIVPSKWLSVVNKKVYTSFMDDPIEGEDEILMQSLIESQADPPSDWSLYHVKIVGRANNFKEAKRKIKLFEKDKRTVLTAESSDDEKKPLDERMIAEIKQRNLLKLQSQMFEKINNSNKTLPATQTISGNSIEEFETPADKPMCESPLLDPPEGKFSLNIDSSW